ncbi:hypothetical protein SEA_PATELGO_257 [Streptomyces phage Patelgo]|nr:hypothetical protein SEA_PATELGO_257 [Streptomyces phage Patelgo]
MNKGLTVAAVAVAGVVTLTACDPGSGTSGTTYYKNGHAGQVVDRDIEDGHYELETKDVKGKKHEFNVTYSVYNDCHKYSYYPSCVKHKNDHKSVTPQWKKSQDAKRKAEKNRKATTNKGKTSKKSGFSFGGSSKSRRR